MKNRHKITGYGLGLCVLCAAWMAGCSSGKEDVSTITDCTRNTCGGCATLIAEPDSDCGKCGKWQCSDDNESVWCEDPGKNACGGCGQLENVPNTSCGEGCGKWTCREDGTLDCVAETNPNECGGCKKLAAKIGDGCGEGCGKWECDGTDSVKCGNDVPYNACGGCGTIIGKKNDDTEVQNPEIGAPCNDACGIWNCDSGDPDKNTMYCNGSDTLNACGGCMPLPGVPDEPCGSGCGKWKCDGQNQMLCNDPGRNVCGGCTPISVADNPETPCDGDGDDILCGTMVCNEDKEGTHCEDPGSNACGGCLTLSATPGDQCGSGDCAKWDCNGTDDVSCRGDNANACGGCFKPIDHAPGEKCADGEGSKACCTWECTDDGDIEINEHDRNACGGCAILDNLGKECGTFKEWECDKKDKTGDSLTCVCPEKNQNWCGGCDGPEYHKYQYMQGASCNYCPGFQGKYRCHGTSLYCSDENETVDGLNYLGKYDDGDGDTYSVSGSLIDSKDVDFYKIHINDKAFASLDPDIWIDNAPAELMLCIYAHEDKDPSDPSYGCGSKCTAQQYAEFYLPDGKKARGFCTTSTTAGSRRLMIDSIKNSSGNNSMDIYIRVKSNTTHSKKCMNYTIKYKF